MGDAKREAELAVIEELQRHRAGGGWAAGGELGKRLDELDRLSSPLPSREELEKQSRGLCVVVPNYDFWGAYWLRWVAEQMVERAKGKRIVWEDGKVVSCPADALVHEDELRDFADELEGRE